MNSKDALEILNIAWSGRKDKDGYPNFDDIHMALYTLDKNLERLEKFAHENASLHTEIESLQSENAKLKKVIEIMVEKKVSQFWIVMSESVDRYNAVMGKNYILTQEEYDLLKEYL